MPYEIIALPKEQWKGTAIPLTTRSDSYPQIYLWVLKENKRAIRFYEKCGFHPDGQEMFSKNVEAPEIRMVRDK